LWEAVTFLRSRVRAISKASRATRFDPLRVITRKAMVMSSLGRSAGSPATTVSEYSIPSVSSRRKTMSTLQWMEGMAACESDGRTAAKRSNFLRTGGITQVGSPRG
jgi:hypothetical protein